MKTFCLVVLFLAFSRETTFAQPSAPTCMPPNFPATYDNSICFGYAQARAFGCSSADAATVNASTVVFDYFKRVTGVELRGVMKGDIMVWAVDGQVNSGNAHAAYVSAAGTIKPVGKTRTDPDGDANDINPPVDPTTIYLDHVLSAGTAPVIGASYITVRNNRPANEQFMGVYRLATPIESPSSAAYRMIFQNSFAGGQVNVDKDGSTWINRKAPDTSYRPYNAHIPAQAIDQTVSETKYVFNSLWKQGDDDYSTSREIEVTVPKAAKTYTAQFSPSSLTNFVQFAIGYQGTNVGGLIQVAGVDMRSPSIQMPTGTSATAYQTLSIDLVGYTFYRWELNGSSYSTNLTIAPSGAGLYVAVYNFSYILPPVEINPYNNPVGEPIKITWIKHTSDYVNQIQIWRKVKDVHAAMVIATLSGSATEFTDYEYTLTDGYTDNLIDYDVRIRYSLNNTYSSPFWFTVFGEGGMMKTIGTERDKPDNVVPQDIRFDAFPNPFNPSTSFSFSVLSDSYVEVKVFGLTGTLISTVVNERVKSGTYVRQWMARDDSGVQLSSGTYFVRFSSVKLDGSEQKAIFRKISLVR